MKLIKTALLGATFLTGAAFAANAADIYQDGGLKDEPGAYYSPPSSWAGIYLGGHLGVAFEDDDNGDDDDTEFLGGLHLGYNWQGASPLVVGLEGDVSFADGIDYLASVRGRLGYAFDNVLLYGTGGAAFIGEDDFDETGYVVGLGSEFKVSNNVSFGVEGLYYDFDDDDFDDNFDFWVARARLSYHLTPALDPLK